MNGFSNSASIFSLFVTKYGDKYPRSNCIPSTVLTSVSVPLASSTVMTPSLPTTRMASAISLPMVSSLLAEMVPTCSILELSSPTSRESFCNSSMMALDALSMPRLRSMGLAPAATLRRPSPMSAWAKTVAVVVPSPATSAVFDATSLTIWAPMFSRASFSSISRATETPSLVTEGAPNFFSMTTLRPFGPSVTLTAFANWSTPALRPLRASVLN